MVDPEFIGLVVIFLGCLVMLPMSSVVVHDYVKTRRFTSETCSGILTHTDIHTSLVNCARGKAVTKFQNSSGLFDRSVELYYPSVNWVLACEKESDVSDWLSGMSASVSFRCYIDSPEDLTGLPDGIQTHYSRIGGWIAMMVISVILIILMICGLVYLSKNR
jgi:uncharacterized membrane protein